MAEAVQVDECSWEGAAFSLGQRIAFDVHARYEGDNQYDRREAVIVELWPEWWANGSIHLLYAECVTDQGEALRVWFHRDKVSEPTGFTGAQVEGALW